MAYSGHGPGKSASEYSTPKVATMESLKKETDRYQESDRYRAILGETANDSKIYICRNCDWTGREPKAHSWNVEGSSWTDEAGQERYTPSHSGFMNKCPKCNEMVRTQKEWESDDFQMRWIPKIVLGVLILGVIVMAFSF